MSDIVHMTGRDGKRYSFHSSKMLGQGAAKNVYSSPDPSYVVAFYRKEQDPNSLSRLETLVTTYRESIFQQSGGAYWKDLFRWPESIVEHDGKTGLIVPRYDARFFFSEGSVENDKNGIRGKEKQGGWFAKHRNRHVLAESERGNWLKFLQISLELARGVRRMHASGLAHSDLSYKNVLVDPVRGTHGRACIIDIDGLVVPGKFPPNVVGTPDFIAPEVVETMHLGLHHPKRALPSRETDLHALAVLIYMYLLRRHPLRGGKHHDRDTEQDERMLMGSRALFIENSRDQSNRVATRSLEKKDLPWGDPSKRPFELVGPYLKTLFERSFVSGLHDPSRRPLAQEYEHALLRTADLLQPCANESCDMRWYPFDNASKPKCPSCSTPYRGLLPVLNLYSKRGNQPYRSDNHRIMVWNGQRLFLWHARRDKALNEHTTQQDRSPVGVFQFHNGRWWLRNISLPRLYALADTKDPTAGQARQHVLPGGHTELKNGGNLLLDDGEHGRLVNVQIAKGS